ncbi:bacterial group 3 Ig-like protein [Lentilactobacillus kisonensis F0435]|uniref:Bacterial group 3 Ig-like protein n=3 Tax=Lentilactobacillus kisonensis TaxID=481722 RepID=H1LDY0_9LACO|nr:bacterial group 3 Ig-like protein [Lentilactobacillus kisonensis F0435]
MHNVVIWVLGIVTAVAIFALIGVTSWDSQKVSANVVNQVHTSIWLTAKNHPDEFARTNSYDTKDNSSFNLDMDKYQDVTVHYQVTNQTDKPVQLEAIFANPTAYSPSPLVYDSSRASEVTAEQSDKTAPKFSVAYYYPKDDGNPTFFPDKKLLQTYMGGPFPSYQTLEAGESLSMAVPLTVAEGYNFNMPVASTSKDTVILKQATEAVYQNAITLNALTFRSIVLSDSPVKAASYNDLITNHEYDGISSLFDANGLPVTGNDHAKAAVEPTNTPGEYKITYTFNGVTKSVTATTDDKSYVNAKDFTVAYGSNWDSEKLNGITGLTDANGNKVTPPADTTVTSIKDAKGETVEKVDTSKAGAVYSVTYTYGKASQTVKVTVGAQNNTPSNGGTTNDSTNTNNSNTSNNLWNPTTSTTTTSQGATPEYATVKGSVVYATKGIYMYKNANFKKSQQITKYPKAKRVNRPMFVVTGYARSNSGTLRYKVRDVNHGKKTANKVGYITASRKYVVNVYYKTMPKNKKITVINKKGVNTYKNANLTKKVKNYKKGTHLRVKKIVKHHLTTRYQLSNGTYLTANKKLVIQGNY